VTRFLVDSASEGETAALAARLGSLLRPGDVLALDGPLGAGKTRFVQGLAAALGADADFVVSPTFGLVHEYPGRIPLYHVDAYRLRDAEEFCDLGGDELIAGDGVLCVEWAGRIADALPPDSLHVAITVLDPTRRRFDLSGITGRGRALVNELRNFRDNRATGEGPA
jgi:tRNA threonylcarbamoyladenosine biosynthesis protein TsaE